MYTMYRDFVEIARVLEGTGDGFMWSKVMEETGEPGQNHRPWMGDQYFVTCLDPDLNPACSGDKRVCYLLGYLM